jgi:hypothetical protein
MNVAPKGDCGEAADKRQGDLGHQQGSVWLEGVSVPYAQQNSKRRCTQR